MNIIKTTDIVAGVAMPIKKGTLDWLQANTKDLAFRNAVAGDPLITNQTTALFGCGSSQSGSIVAVGSGVVLYQQETYTLFGQNVTLGVGEVVVCTIVEESEAGATYDPVEFSDGTFNDVHIIRRIILSAGATGSGTFDLSAIRFSHEPYEQLYNAGLLTAGSGTVTLTNGVDDFFVDYYINGKECTVSFKLTNVVFSATPSYFEIQMPGTIGASVIGNMVVKKYALNIGLAYQGSTPSNVNILAIDDSNKIRISLQTGSFSGTYSLVAGQLTFTLRSVS